VGTVVKTWVAAAVSAPFIDRRRAGLTSPPAPREELAEVA
jgi:hypothetical protein